MSSNNFEIKCFLHCKENNSDKVYGILKSKDTIFCFYGKRNPPEKPKEKGTLSIKYYEYMDTDEYWDGFMKTKINKGYKPIYVAERKIVGYWDNRKLPQIGNIADIEKVYYNLEGSIRSKLLKAVLKFT